ncbi:MAG: class I tRNA ligase family protein, partial [Porphyrobacter sp.]|nr:class I tRNA ligase family protein [Porphyrobacter sp.]
FNWMENIQPWCVSRQLWWGHRIPAWYGFNRDETGVPVSWKPGSDRPNPSFTEVQVPFVAETLDEAQRLAREYYVGVEPDAPFEIVSDAVAGSKSLVGGFIPLWQDPDVLDTWFSSALWPFATLGWPDADAPLLAKHYPNDLLISGFDILFFWDARMAMMGMHLMGEVPWKRLYLHGLVRAADGAKMSKSKGNVVDPLGLIDRYGADALRFFMAAMESQGRDVKMDESRVEGYRNFATKLWNAARFCQSNGIGASPDLAAPQAQSAVNRWIIGEVVETLAALDKAMAELRFDAAANAIYHFVWDRFCDWYLELIKGQIDAETRAVAGWVLDQILVMLHPFMPFVTEELWHAQGERPYALIVARWPQPQAQVDAAAKAEVEWLIGLTSAVRAARNELGIAPGARLEAFLAQPSATARAVIGGHSAAIERLARLSAVRFEDAPAGAAMQVASGADQFVLPLGGVIDIAAEKARLAKARDAAEKEAQALARRLGNPAFMEKAKPEAIDKARADHAHHAAEVERLDAALARLG